MRSDADIIRRSVRNPRAFHTIFERHYDAVLSFARRRTDWATGEEVAAQTFLVALERVDTFNLAYSSARPWLLGVANNLVRRAYRDQITKDAAAARMPIESEPAPIDDPSRLDAVRHHDELIRALGTLNSNDRETFLLVVLGGLSYSDAALALDVPMGTVRSRVHRARMLLREQLAGLEGTFTWNDPEGEPPWTT